MYKFDGFDCDEGKRKLTLEIRGLDLLNDAPAAMSDPLAITVLSTKDGEERYKTIAEFKGKLYAVVHTQRNEKCRIITMRRAHKDEEEAYNGHNRT